MQRKAYGFEIKKGLIVPLWNWNVRAFNVEKSGQQGLIVPLWNWNCDGAVYAYRQQRGLIVPLWNWNDFSPILKPSVHAV